MPEKDESIEKKSITISGKDFITGLAFVFTLSGVYYKLYFEMKEMKTTAETQNAARVAENAATLELAKKNQSDLRQLMDDKTRRDAIEEIKKQENFQPMKRVK